MLTEPFEPDTRKNWSQLVSQIKEIYRKVNECMGKPSFAFKFSNLHNSNGDQIGIRVYCLGPVSNGTESTLLFCDVTNDDQNQIQFNADGSLSGSAALQNSTTGDQPTEDDDNLKLNTFKWRELIHSGLVCKDDEAAAKMSIEEKLQLERKRMPVTGIVAYEFHEQQKRFVFSLEGSLHYVDDNGQAPYLPTKLPSQKQSAKINPSICPTNADLVAYVSDNDLYVLNIRTGVELQLTDNKREALGRTISAGLPCYIVQEEFNRYVGLWWQPTGSSPNEYKILFEQVDETDVELIKLATYDGSTEEYRYPKPGRNNAVSLPKIANFKIDSSTNEFRDVNVSFVNGISDLKQIYSEGEYLVNCGWFDHDSITVHLLNRSQQNLLVFLISLSGAFAPQALYEEANRQQWVETTEVCEFLRNSEPGQASAQAGQVLEFIWASQETGYRHLYKISVRLSKSDSPVTGEFPLKSDLLGKVQLTHGNWEVSSEDVWLDSKNRLVYFIGLKDSPLEKQLYVLSLDQEQECIQKLTTPGYSNSLVVFNSQHSVFLNVQSSISKPPFGFLNVLHRSLDQLPSAHRVGYLVSNKTTQPDGTLVSCAEQFEMLPGFSRPVLFSYQLKESGEIVYGLIYKPDFMQADKKYPCVLEVYGGPAVQLVTNTFRSVRLIGRHVLASQGYVVCVLDCRGSANRGKAFEAHTYRKLGQLEINDQVEVLTWLAASTNYIDLNRVAIHGFSYGGYLSLLGYALRPDIFKCCLAGAPVTSWQLYDTGYTERYMDTPENNAEGYAKGSVLNHVSNFPNEENRLLIIHGLNDENVHFQHSAELIHELVKAAKPYTLQIYPNERHSLRNGPTRVHFETLVLSFLNQNL